MLREKLSKYRKKKSVPTETDGSHLKQLIDSPDSAIEAELLTLPGVVITDAEQLIRAMMLWLVMVQDDPQEYPAFKKEIVAEIRAFDDFMRSRAPKVKNGMSPLMAQIYYLVLWHNTLKTSRDFNEISEVANGLVAPKDENIGYR